MILDHPLGETLDVGIFRFLSDLAELDLRHAADRGLPDKGLVFLVQRIFGGSRSGVAGLPGLGKNWGAASSPTAMTAVVVRKRSIMITPGTAFSPFNRRVRGGVPYCRNYRCGTFDNLSNPPPFSLSMH